MTAPTLVGPTLEELQRALPRGLTGARLDALTLRPAERVLELALLIDMGEDAGVPQVRPALLRLSGVGPIDFGPESAKQGKGPNTIRAGALAADALATLGWPAPAPPGFAAWIQGPDAGSELRFVATHAELEWLGDTAAAAAPSERQPG